MRYVNRSQLILERLDTCFVNNEWIQDFPCSNVSHLHGTRSDYCPMLISLWPNALNKTSKPFRFKPMWCSHPSFANIVQRAYEGCGGLERANVQFQTQVMTWNMIVFGTIFHKKKHIITRHWGIQKFNAFPFNTFFQNLEGKLLEEYSSILKYEDVFWKTKLMINWIMEGDVNTRFFHTYTLNMRRRNKIMSCKMKQGTKLRGNMKSRTLFISTTPRCSPQNTQAPPLHWKNIVYDAHTLSNRE